MQKVFEIEAVVAATGEVIRFERTATFEIDNIPADALPHVQQQLLGKIAEAGVFKHEGDAVTFFPVQSLRSLTIRPQALITVNTHEARGLGIVL